MSIFKFIFFVFLIVVGIFTFVTADESFGLQWIVGLTIYISGWILGLLLAV